MQNNYCDIQKDCKLLIQANTQYDLGVKQNKSLQQDLRHKDKQLRIAIKWLKNILAEPVENDYAYETVNILLHVQDKVKAAFKEIEVKMTIEDFEDKAWEAIHKANEETLKNLKEDEALFDGMAYYTQKKCELHTARAFVSYIDNSVDVLWAEDAEDEEFVEDYITSQRDKIPSGTFFIEFWWKNERTSYEYDEWDYVTSLNFNIELYSSLNFEQTFKDYKQQTQKLQAISKRLKEHCSNCPCEYDCKNHNLDDMSCPCFDILEILKGEENAR